MYSKLLNRVYSPRNSLYCSEVSLAQLRFPECDVQNVYWNIVAVFLALLHMWHDSFCILTADSGNAESSDSVSVKCRRLSVWLQAAIGRWQSWTSTSLWVMSGPVLAFTFSATLGAYPAYSQVGLCLQYMSRCPWAQLVSDKAVNL